MVLDELSQIADEVDCSKHTLCGFTKHFHELFKPYRDKEFNLFEIGIWYGASLRMWERYFTKATIYAIDIDPKSLHHSSDRVHTYFMSQNNKERLTSLMDYIGNIFIACDDGSHDKEDIVTSLGVIHPYIEDGGYYIVEDILPENKDYVNSYLKTIPMKEIVRVQSVNHADIDMVILQK